VDGDPATLQQRQTDWAVSAPTFGPYIAWSNLVCAQWPVPASGAPFEVTVATQTPVLVVSKTHDPATPLAWAQRLTEALPDAKLVTYDDDGHTAYGNNSSCVDEVVDAYLVEGDLPSENVECS
jgi:pimeloyl-ACP methyl ester carboxylesterase